MRGQILGSLGWLFLMLIAWSVLFASGADSFFALVTSDTIANPDVPNYIKTILEIIPAAGFLGIAYGFYLYIQGRQRDEFIPQG